jgi:hypothetical protein
MSLKYSLTKSESKKEMSLNTWVLFSNMQVLG